MFYLVLDPTRKTTYVDVAWDADWIEDYMNRLRDIVGLSIIPKENPIILINYMVVYEVSCCIPGLEERRCQPPS